LRLDRGDQRQRGCPDRRPATVACSEVTDHPPAPLGTSRQVTENRCSTGSPQALRSRATSMCRTVEAPPAPAVTEILSGRLPSVVANPARHVANPPKPFRTLGESHFHASRNRRASSAP